MNSEVDIVERLRHSQTAYGWINRQNEEAANEIERLRAALSTEAQPEVTGAVAWMYEDDASFDGSVWNTKFSVTTSKTVAEFKSGTIKKPIPLYPSSAIQEAVREKLEEAARIVRDDMCFKLSAGSPHRRMAHEVLDKVRALMESPQPSVEEPAN